MNKNELEKLTNMVAQKTAELVMERLNGSSVTKANDTEYVTCEEAARILGFKPNYLRQVKDRYPHIKAGNTKQGRIMFRRDALLNQFNI